MRSTILSILAAAVVSGTAAAETQNGGAPGDWLARYGAARSVGLGGAFVATADEPLGTLWNPAGISFMYQNEARFETARLFDNTAVHSVGMAIPSRRFPSVGVSLLALNSGEFERTDELNEPLGTFSTGDIALLLTASKTITPKLAAGLNFKMVRQSVEEFDGTGVGVDLGALYDVSPMFRVGFSFLNLGGPNLTLRDTEASYPGQRRGGFAARVLNGKGLFSAEVDHTSEGGASLHAGAEYWLYPQVAVRFGMNETAPAGGLSYRFPSGLQVDYGLADEELGVAHRIGVSYRFGGFFASSLADPDVFSPLGQQSVTKFHLKSKTKAETTDWSLDIVNKTHQTVRTFGGKGVPPAHVMWDGKDESGLPCPDGTYTYLLVVHDGEGRTITGRERLVEISTGGPQGSVPVAIN
jgi:hypothetical protein